MDQTETELTIVRVFDAPPALVFRMWTDPAHASRWMGPRGFTAEHVTQDPRPGGAWRLCLREDATGRLLWQGGVNREIDPPHRLVFTFAWDRDSGISDLETVVTITFEDYDGKTRMVFHQAPFATTDSRDGHVRGWSSSFDRFEELLRAA